MKKSSPRSDHCEHSAEKVQSCLQRGKNEIFPTPPESSLGSHKCDMVKIPRVPSQVGYLPLYGYEKVNKEKQEKQLNAEGKETIDPASLNDSDSKLGREAHHTHCCISQKNYYQQLNAFIESTANLGDHQFSEWRQKEHNLVCRKLKKMALESSLSPRRHDFTKITPVQTPEETQNQEYLEEMRRPKDHHLFNIGTIHTPQK